MTRYPTQNKSIFGVFYQTLPPTHKPWRIVETYMSSDGPRSRICDGVWATEEQVLKELANKEKQLEDQGTSPSPGHED